ncbi:MULTISPECIES: hypothetical protein [Sphingomonas]|jgi:hypothetical protein|uniref:hypothetical protein n=1 Tax=Sphingomonas TaxID=13687 RepID=UPI001AE8BF53
MKGEREIWFYKILWSYMPIHWKGWAFTVALVAIALALVFGTQAVCRHFGVPGADDWPFFLMFPVVVAGWFIAERHV